MSKEKWVLVLLKAWEDDELTTFAYEVTRLYNSLDLRLINNVMTEFKEKLTS